MNERAYKHAFVIVVVICLGLVGVLAYVVRGRHASDPVSEESIVAAKGPDVAEQPSSATASSPANPRH